MEVNFDGLVGPTHNYAGLSFGNRAAMSNEGGRSNPRAAALQGLAKMRALLDLGLRQGVLPPQERPFLPALRGLGFAGEDAEILQSAWARDRGLVANLSSASAMWAANAATVSPSADTMDKRVHFTPANLVSMPHRSFEPKSTTKILRAVFPDETRFVVHDPLPANALFADEGAANHNRLAPSHAQDGVEVFVYGRIGLDGGANATRFPGRQTKEACEAIARNHQLADKHAVHIEQSRIAIDAGAFHNDVVCVTNETAVFFHEAAFEHLDAAKNAIRRAANDAGFDPDFIMAPASELPLEDAVKSYVFNSQLITLPGGGMALILPSEVDETPSARQFVDACVDGDGPIVQARVFDLRESMRNGGGPACLRLRVPLTASEQDAVHAPCLLDGAKIDALEAWVKRHYRDRLDPLELGDPQLLVESQTALDELTTLLDFGAIYEFQRAGAGGAAAGVCA